MHGILHKIEVDFPPGCRKMVKVIIRCPGLFQVSPLNPDGQHKADAYTISYPAWYPLEEEPYMLVAEAWSPGTTYPHNITIRLGIEKREALEPGREAIGILTRLRDLIFGRR